MNTEQERSERGDDVQLGLIGLGKMGGNMATRLRRADIEVVGYDHSPG
jgi:6-phosphogluconate dehydrogenase